MALCMSGTILGGSFDILILSLMSRYFPQHPTLKHLPFLYREFFNFVDRFMVTGASLAVRHIGILPMNQHA
jgi:hypothetical protein